MAIHSCFWRPGQARMPAAAEQVACINCLRPRFQDCLSQEAKLDCHNYRPSDTSVVHMADSVNSLGQVELEWLV